MYEGKRKAFINFHASHTRIEGDFLEDRFQFWDTILHRPRCTSFRWYHTCLLVGVLLLVIILLSIYILYNAKRSRRNIKPTEGNSNDVVTTYHFLSPIVS